MSRIVNVAVAALASCFLSSAVYAAPVSFALDGSFLIESAQQAASGSISFNTDNLQDVDCEDGDLCLALADLEAFALSFDDPGFANPGPFGLGDLIGDGAQIVFSANGTPDALEPVSLMLDIAFSEGFLLEIFAEDFAGGVFSFSGSLSALSPDPGPGTGSTGGGRPDGVIPLPATLPLLLGALGVAGLVLRRRAA